LNGGTGRRGPEGRRKGEKKGGKLRERKAWDLFFQSVKQIGRGGKKKI